MTDAIEREIRTLEDERCAATIAVNEPALQRLFHDELIYTHSSGVVDTKASYIAGLKSGKFRYREMTRSEERVRVYQDTALVTGRALIQVAVNDVPKTLRVAFLDAWVRTSAGWQFVAWQSASLPS